MESFSETTRESIPDARRLEMNSIPRVSTSDVELLTGKNFKTWAQKIKFVLSINKVWVDPSKEFEAQDQAEKQHMNPSLSNIVGTTRKLFNMKLVSNEDMNSHDMKIR